MINFILNPNSRSGKGKRRWNELERKIKASGLSHRIYTTEYAGQATEIAGMLSDELDERIEAVVAVGGDGTLNEVVSGLPLEIDPIIGYIPTGSGNDFARGLNLSHDSDDSLERILHAKRLLPLDIGEITYGDGKTRRFCVSCGVGYDAAICADMLDNHLKKKLNHFHIGDITYTIVGVKQASTYPMVPAKLTIDDNEPIEIEDMAFCSIHNLKYEGGGWPFAPDADPSDGYLDICVVHPKSRLVFAEALISSKIKGLHTRFDEVSMFRCKKLSVELERPLFVHTDGEVLGEIKEFQIRCLPKAIRLMI